MTNYEKVMLFHDKMGAAVRTVPQAQIPEAELRVAFIREELTEYEQAILSNDVVGVADALATYCTSCTARLCAMVSTSTWCLTRFIEVT